MASQMCKAPLYYICSLNGKAGQPFSISGIYVCFNMLIMFLFILAINSDKLINCGLQGPSIEFTQKHGSGEPITMTVWLAWNPHRAAFFAQIVFLIYIVVDW